MKVETSNMSENTAMLAIDRVSVACQAFFRAAPQIAGQTSQAALLGAGPGRRGRMTTLE